VTGEPTRSKICPKKIFYSEVMKKILFFMLYKSIVIKLLKEGENSYEKNI